MNYFTNATIDVTCPGANSEEETFAGFIDLIPQELNGVPFERNYECTSLEFKDGDDKEITFLCKSPFTQAEISEKIAAIKKKCE